ncbi:MAG TPA: hypothetical protein VHK69_03375 [Chitinophagaceae bacterium]|jgi:hypothetical protein|nr:hypothetical protein [Chitinophagaceae bacterium]
MSSQRPGVDIINEVLEACILAFPVSSFIISLYKQYIHRGWLTKGQLQGLLSKAQKAPDLAPGKLAALEALIKKMPTRYKSEAPPPAPLYTKDEATGRLIEDILAKYPQHKAVLGMKNKYDRNEPLTTAEQADLQRFSKRIRE